MNRFYQFLLVLTGLLLAGSAEAQTSTTPTGLTVNVTYGGSICLQWTPNVASSIPYEVERSDDGRSGWSKVGDSQPVASSAFSMGNYCDENLPSLRTYYYRVRGSLGRNAYTNYSNNTSGTTKAAPSTPPTPRLTVQTGAIQVIWGTEFSRIYELERADGPRGTYQVVNTQNSGRNSSLTFTSNGNAGQEYCFRVRVKDPQEGTSGYSNVACNTIPNAASNIRNFRAEANGSPSSIKLTWDRYGKESPITIERRDGQTGNWSKLRDWLADSGEYTDTGLQADKEYCYRIQESGRDVSETKCAITAPGPPITPGPLNVLVKSATELQPYWGDNNVIPVTFDLEQATSLTGTYRVIASGLTQSQKIYDDKGLAPSTQYCYRVRAKNSAGVYSNYTPAVCNTTQAPPVAIPSPPTELVLQVVDDKQITLRWKDNSNNETNFAIERSTDGKRTWQRHKDVDRNTTSYDDGGLNASSQYCYRVFAYNTAGSSRTTDELCATTNAPPATAPAKPTNLKATAQSGTDIKLTWTDNSANETHFELQRSLTGNDPWENVDATIAPNTQEKTDGGRSASTRYYYRIRAVLVVGRSTLNSDWSDVANDITQAPPAGTPQNFMASAKSESEITLTWTSLAGAGGYELDRSATGNDPWQRVNNPAGNATSYTDGGLTANTRYYYRLRALGVTGAPGPYSTADATTKAFIVSPPGTLSATAVGSAQIDLKWLQSPSTFASGYILEVKPPGGSYGPLVTLNGVGTTTYSHNGLMPSTQYCYRVRTNGTPPSDFGPEACATTPAPPQTVPRPPSNLSVTAQSPADIKLTWFDNSDNEAEFEIWWATSQTAQFTRLTNVGANTREYLHTGLAASSPYCYQVRAINTAGQSTFAGPQCATTQAPPPTPPAAPTDFAANVASISSINLAWKDNSSNETGFEIQFSLNNADPWTSLPSQTSNVTAFTHPGLTANTRYYYRLRAVNGVGPSAWVTANAITPALPVPSTNTDLKAEVADYDQIKLTWGAITNNPTGIVIERATSPTGSFTQIGQPLPGTSVTFTDTGLPEMTTFYYRIRSANANGPSGNSNVAMATTPESIIAVRPQPLPEGIYAHVDHGTLFVTLNWNQFQEAKLRVIGLNGREQLTDQCRINGGTLFQYDVAHLPGGVYVLCLDTDKNRFTKKIWIP